MIVHITMIRRALQLKERREEMLDLLRQLNDVNKYESHVSIPEKVLEYVDHELAAKGLISLLVESIAQNEKDLQALGVDLSEVGDARKTA